MDPAKIGQVVGLGSSVPFDDQDPLSPVNRRISIIVLTEQADATLLDQSRSASIEELTADAGESPDN
jgi:chemotaxis protein MotB